METLITAETLSVLSYEEIAKIINTVWNTNNETENECLRICQNDKVIAYANRKYGVEEIISLIEHKVFLRKEGHECL